MHISNEIYEKNVKSIQKRNAYLLDQMGISGGITRNKVEISIAKDGNQTCSFTSDRGTTFIHSPYRPQEEAQRWYSSLELQGAAVICMCGFGLGYHVLQVTRNLRDEQKLIIYEPCIQILQAAIKCKDLSEIFENENVQIVTITGEHALKTEIFNKISWMQSEYTVCISVPIYERLFPDECRVFIDAVKTAVRFALIKRDTILSSAHLWTTNVIKNIPHIMGSAYAGDLTGLLRGLPIVVAAAGPSLNKNVDLLKKIKGRVLILCVDTALKVLLGKGITPDFVVCIDQYEANMKHFEGTSYMDIPLVYSSTVDSKILDNHRGKKILLTLGEEYISFLMNHVGKTTKHFRRGGSVSHFSMDFALMLGANPIIFIGLDLAFTGNASHAMGTAQRQEITDEEWLGKTDYVKGVDGNQILTSKVLKAFHTWFEGAISVDQSGRSYINATEGGAYIEGMLHMSFQEAIEKYCVESNIPKADIENAIQKSRVFGAEGENRIINLLVDTYKGIEELQVLCREGMHLCLEISRTSLQSSSEVNEISDKIASVLKGIDLTKWLEEVVEYKLYLYDHFTAKPDNIEVVDERIERNLLYFKYVKELADIIEPILSTVLNELEAV